MWPLTPHAGVTRSSLPSCLLRNWEGRRRQIERFRHLQLSRAACCEVVILFSLFLLLNTVTYGETCHHQYLFYQKHKDSFCKLNLVSMKEVGTQKGHLSGCGVATHLLDSSPPLQLGIMPYTTNLAAPCSRACISRF